MTNDNKDWVKVALIIVATTIFLIVAALIYEKYYKDKPAVDYTEQDASDSSSDDFYDAAAPPSPPPPLHGFHVIAPMVVKRVSAGKYKVTLEATDFCSATFTWHSMIASTPKGSKAYDKFDKKKHEVILTGLPENDSVYISAELVKIGAPPTVKAYQAGMKVFTTDFELLEITQAADRRLRVWSTKKSTIWFFGGKNATELTDNFSTATNPTEVSAGRWRHSATLPDKYTHWSAVLQHGNNKLHVTARKFE